METRCEMSAAREKHRQQGLSHRYDGKESSSAQGDIPENRKMFMIAVLAGSRPAAIQAASLSFEDVYSPDHWSGGYQLFTLLILSFSLMASC